MFERYNYVDEMSNDISSFIEKNKALEAFKLDKKEGKVDKKLERYLIDIFDTNLIFPYFSCSGHSIRGEGYILFRSLYPIEQTISYFRPVLVKFIYHKLDLKVYYTRAGGIGYSLGFKTKDLDKVLSFFVKSLKIIKESKYD